MFFGSLGVHIGAHCFKCRTADTADEIRPAPEQGLAVEGCHVVGKATSCTSGAGRLEVANQHRNIACRMDVDQQVDMIAPWLAVGEFIRNIIRRTPALHYYQS